MSETLSGFAKKFLDAKPSAIFTHSFGHILNLACSDAIKKNSQVKLFGYFYESLRL